MPWRKSIHSMSGKFVRAVMRVVFWNYPRGGWQYDIASGLILAFIFLTPKAVFEGAIFSQAADRSFIESETKVALQVDDEIE